MNKLWKWFLPGYLLALPHTIAGLIVCTLLYRAKNWRLENGVITCEATKDLIGGKWVGAQTWGTLIIYRNERMRAYKPISVHEHVHVVQGMLLGPLYLLSYGAHFIFNLVTSDNWRDAYYDVWAEVMAYRIQAEYTLGEIKNPLGS